MQLVIAQLFATRVEAMLKLFAPPPLPLFAALASCLAAAFLAAAVCFGWAGVSPHVEEPHSCELQDCD